MLLGMLALAIAATFIGVFLTVGGDDDEVGAENGGGTETAAPNGGGEGDFTIVMGDNFFEFQGQRNPNIPVQVGGTGVLADLTNEGRSIHNMRIAGLDNRYDNQDDIISSPETIRAGQDGTIAFTFTTAGTYDFRCDFHPDDMVGTITAQ
jgi:plastocyanin